MPDIPLTHEGIPRRNDCQRMYGETLKRNDPALLNKRLLQFQAKSND
jgi:hypothetical protein